MSINKPALSALLILLSFSAYPSSCQAQSQAARDKQKTQAELAAKYKKNTLYDISPDGSMMLMYGASTPKKEVKSGGVTEWLPQRGEEFFDMLRVVELATGRERGRVHVHVPPVAARFVGTTKQVCYQIVQDNQETKQVETLNRLWDYTSGKLGVCPAPPEKGAYGGSEGKYDSTDGKLAAETSRETVREFLAWKYVRGVVTIYDRGTGERIGVVVHQTVREPYDWPLSGYVYSVAFSPDGKRLMTSYEEDTYIWDIKPLPGK
jgi:hypothetical protein